VAQLNTEAAKANRFLICLKDLFGEVDAEFVERYLQGVEKYVRSKEKDILLRGKIDALFGNLVIEFERDLNRSLEEAKEQLQKYIAFLWSNQKAHKINYLGVATDGVLFFVYSPKTAKSTNDNLMPGDIELEEIDKCDFSTIAPYQVYVWLDRYFFRKRKLSPTSEEIVKDFGLRSHAFVFSNHTFDKAWQNSKDRTDLKVIYENWEKYLRITYGTLIGGEELFIRHTYLATLAKLMVWMRLSERESIPSSAEILQILNGEYFRRQRIVNFLEEDFFSWITREATQDFGLDVSKKLINQLLNYNLRELSEDILKALYQELVDPETRHDLGEYYTPDWLARSMVETALEENPTKSVLDPACGSGTFLYMTVKFKREMLGDSRKTLDHIQQNVVGVDIHPLAVITAKTNYLLALGDLIKKRKGSIEIPIYLADAIKLPEKEVSEDLFSPLPGYKLHIANKNISIPKILSQDSHLYDEAIEICKEFATIFAHRKNGDKQAFLSFVENRSKIISKNEKLCEALFLLSSAMKELIEEERDTIWAFILKNLYKPMFLREKFDVILGNPPWLSYRYVEKGEYQNFLKEQIVTVYRLLSRKVGPQQKTAVKAELITHMELATLFFVCTSDLYLKTDGLIGFVLPRSVFSADQHDVFRRGKFSSNVGIFEVWDLEKVEPLFNVPACVFWGQSGHETKSCLNSKVFSGKLNRKNASLQEANEVLAISKQSLYFTEMGKRSFFSPMEPTLPVGKASVYKSVFRQGATIVPRNFWFVEIKSDVRFGFDPTLPFVQTAQSAIKTAKKEYKDVRMSGNIEHNFLYATLLSTDLIPFGHLNFRLVVLPILAKEGGYSLLNERVARQKGFTNLAQWLERAQQEWVNRRREKSERIDATSWLDYRKKLTGQNRLAKFKVLYPTSATYLCGCVVKN
ncbi:MAG: N-6 DNA methylase, partial [bacterium]